MVMYFIRDLKKCKGGSHTKFWKNILESQTLSWEEIGFLIDIVKLKTQWHKSSK